MNIGDFQTQDTIRFVTQKLSNLEKEKKEENKKHGAFVKNIMLLIIAQIVIKLLGLIYRIVIVNIPGFGDTGNGYYSSGYEIYALMLTISSIGIPTVISKLVSERIAIGDKKGADRIFKIALKLFTAIGAVLSLILFIGSDWIATNILNVPDVSLSLKFLAPAVFIVSWAAILRGYFTGIEDMKPTGISQTLEQFLNCILTIVLIYAVSGTNAATMAAAGNLAATISIVLAFIYLKIYYQKNKLKVEEDAISHEEEKSNFEIIKTILALSIPITIGSLISVMNTFIDTTTILSGVQKAFESTIPDRIALELKSMEMKGILSKVSTIVGLPMAVNVAISTALTPAIAGFMAKNEKEKAVQMVHRSMDLSLMLVLPMCVGMFVLADPILNAIYPSSPEGGMLMKILCIPTLFICINYILGGALQGVGNVIIPSVGVLAGAICKIAINLILIPIPSINVYGAAISSVISQFIALMIAYIATKNAIGYKINKKSFVSIFLVSAFMGVVSYITYEMTRKIISGYIIPVGISTIVGVVVYVVTLILSGVLTKEILETVPKGHIIIELLERREEKLEGRKRLKERKERIKNRNK